MPFVSDGPTFEDLHEREAVEALCELCQYLDEQAFSFLKVPKAVTWWEKHKERDRKRAEEELKRETKDREKLLASLTLYQKRLLNIIE